MTPNSLYARVARMVSMAHEVLVDLFKNRPSLAAEILSEVLGVEMPVYAQARLASIDLTEIQPAEYRADVVVVLLLEGDVPVRVIVVEVQLDKKERKRFTWPAYLAVCRAVHECPADLLVVAPDAGVAAWCAEPIEIGAPGFVLRPQVLRRVDVPVVESPEEAARRPELGVLSAMAHGDSEKGAAIASVVLPVLGGLDDDRARFYYDLVCNSLNEAARKALDEKMKGYEYQSDFAKKYVAQGRAEGEALLLLRALAARGIAVSNAERERILGERDVERLERWFDRAMVAASLADVLDKPS